MFRLRVESSALEATSVAMWSVRLAPLVNTGTLAIGPDKWAPRDRPDARAPAASCSASSGVMRIDSLTLAALEVAPAEAA